MKRQCAFALLIGGLLAAVGTVSPVTAAETVRGPWTTVKADYRGDVRVEVDCPAGTSPSSSDVTFRGGGVKFTSGNPLPRRIVNANMGYSNGGQSAFTVIKVKTGRAFQARAEAACAPNRKG